MRDGTADYACVPIENSIEGSILPTLDSLATGTPLRLFAELTLDVAFSIVVRDGVVDRPTSRPSPRSRSPRRRSGAGSSEHLPHSRGGAGELQCRGRASTSIAGKADAGGHHGARRAAVRPDRAGRRRRRRAECPHPVRAGRPARADRPARTGADRTSVVLRLDNTPGALVAALTEFGIRDIDLTRIESRPTRTELGTYVFFLDCVGHIDDTAVAEALKALHRRCADVRFLGSWPTGSVTGAVPPEMDEADHWLAECCARNARGRAPPGRLIVSGRLVLLRHGQSHSNVERCLGHPAARRVADSGGHRAGPRLRARLRPARGHARALGRGQGRRDRGGDRRGVGNCRRIEVEGIHEVQVGDLEMRNDDEAVDAFNRRVRAVAPRRTGRRHARRRDRRAGAGPLSCRC